MANIVLKTYAAGENNQGSVTPQNDALIYQAAIPMNGIFSGAVITLSSANVLHVAAGMGIIGGRFFEVLESDIPVQLSVSGDLLGRLYIHLDLSNADNPIEINAVTGASLPALQGDPDLNISNGVFDMELCTFDINELTISNIVQTFPTITAANNQIRRATTYSVNDLVFCQSASKSLIFICTTAGATAVQEPTAYTTVTDGNTVTDGTAVFKAVSVSGQITKLSKTEDLIAYVQTTLTASKSYNVGEQFIYNGLLYKATAAIAQGGTIVIGGNAELADSVTGQIKTVRENFGIVKFDISAFSGNQTYFIGYGIYDKSSGTVRIYVASYGNLTSSPYIGIIPTAYKPTSDAEGAGTVDGNETPYIIYANSGYIYNRISGSFQRAMCVAEYQI